MQNEMNYYRISRAEWAQLEVPARIALTNEQLAAIRSVNDQLSLKDVREVYLPLVRLLGMELRQRRRHQQAQAALLGIPPAPAPFILGIAGSVAVGKSTIARLLNLLLRQVFPDKRVQQITTDGFIYPNAELKRRGLFDRKGFPESYDMPRLITFLNDIKNGVRAEAPAYSHEISDVVPGEFDVVDHPDILIVEGINVLQLPPSERVYVSDYFDFSLYVDAAEEDIERWYLERFGMLLEMAAKDPHNYYYQYTQGPREDAFAMAKRVWRDVNLKNLHEYILPTRNRADLILSKDGQHRVTELLIRKA